MSAEIVRLRQHDVIVTLADGTSLPGCRPDLLSIGDLLARGWSIFPLKSRSKLPAVRSWLDYQKRMLTVDELEQWFSTPSYNVAIVTGKISGIFVVDLDSPAAVAWAAEHLPPCDLRVRTAKGIHYYFPYSGDLVMRNKARIKCARRPRTGIRGCSRSPPGSRPC